MLRGHRSPIVRVPRGEARPSLEDLPGHLAPRDVLHGLVPDCWRFQSRLGYDRFCYLSLAVLLRDA